MEPNGPIRVHLVPFVYTQTCINKIADIQAHSAKIIYLTPIEKIFSSRDPHEAKI